LKDSNKNSDAHFFRASDSLRRRLKDPLGELIPDANVSKRLLQKRVFNSLDTLIASVGDRTTERLNELGLVPDLEVIDNLEQRGLRPDPLRWAGENERFLETVNSPGGIDTRALASIKKSFELLKDDPKQKVRLLVDGEEDLLVLPIVAFYQGRSMTLYGQPNSGLVIVDSLKARNLCVTYLRDLGIEVP
jgi:uncharacterized protein (UPF0218 family)